MPKPQTPSQLTEQAIRQAMETLSKRHDLSPEARARGIASLQRALERLHTYYDKRRSAPIHHA